MISEQLQQKIERDVENYAAPIYETIGYSHKEDFKAGATPYAKQCSKLYEAAKKINHLHCCEQEGISSGQPTPKQWFDAVNELAEALSDHEKFMQQ